MKLIIKINLNNILKLQNLKQIKNISKSLNLQILFLE